VPRAFSLELRYFDARGAAEVSRVILALSGREYVDHRYAIERKEGGGFTTPEFSALTRRMVRWLQTRNLNRAPLLLVDVTPITRAK
jgi:hypothetical protein